MPVNKGKLHKLEGKSPIKKGNMPPSNISIPGKAEKRDIDILFGSGTRIDVLTLLINNSDWGFMQSEIAGLTQRSPKDVSRVLKNLIDIGLVINLTGTSGILPGSQVDKVKSDTWLENELKVRGVTRYRLNTGHPWLPALKMILENALGSLHVLREEITKFISIDIAFVYGSFATAEQTPESDIDVVFIGYQTIKSLVADISRIEKRINREIDFRTYTPDDWRKKYEEKNHFVLSLLETPKIYLVGNDRKLERITIED